jgi:hypothetical protein
MVFEDLFYPWNTDRAIRVTQLGMDCAEFIAQQSEYKRQIDVKLSQANDSIKSAYKDKACAETSPFEVESVEIGSWIPEVADVVIPLLAMPSVSSALVSAARCYVMSSGMIVEGEEILAFSEFPLWLRAGTCVSTTVAFVAITVAVDAVFSSIVGEIRREKLNSMISESYNLRVALKHNSMINYEVMNTLDSLISSLNAIKQVKGITDDQITSMLNELIKDAIKKVDSITVSMAKDNLKKYDQDRRSWMEEDPK